MKIVKALDNDKLREVTEQAKHAYNDILSSTLNTYTQTDEEYNNRERTLDKIKQLSELDRFLLFIYADYGATEASKMLGISREYMHALVRKIKDKIIPMER